MAMHDAFTVGKPPSSGATRHLLPDGEKKSAPISQSAFLSPSGRGWIARQRETGEGSCPLPLRERVPGAAGQVRGSTGVFHA
jgi:hypothetical protein